MGLGALIGQRQVKKVICSFARSAKGITFPELYNKGEIELEVVPQGTLKELEQLVQISEFLYSNWCWHPFS